MVATSNGAPPDTIPHGTLPLSRHRVEFPPPDAAGLTQDEAFFHIVEAGARVRIRFHDYHDIYGRPGLYEQLFYDRLKCQSPQKVAEVLHQALVKAGEAPESLRVLDLGAGNGMAGEALTSFGVSRLVGIDIIEEAREATHRDRPGLYDHYYVTDVCDLDDGEAEELRSWSFNCMLSVAALGFGDIPPMAVARTLDLIEPDGWIAFNIKDTFLDATDSSGFSTMVRELIFSEYLDLHHLERYRHRLSIDGRPLNYFAVVGRKCRNELPEAVRELLAAEAEAV